MCARTPVNVRLEPDFAETLSEEAESLGRSRSDYIRAILRRRERILPLGDLDDGDRESIHARVERLERVVLDAQPADSDVSGPDTADYDIVAGAVTSDYDDADTDDGGQTAALGWRAQLADDLDEMGVTDANDRERVESLAAFLKDHGHLSRKAALENDVVTEWGWDKCKDWLAQSSVARRPDQRTWSWTGADG